MIQAFHANGTPLSLVGKTSAESMAVMLTIEELHHIRVYPDADTTDMLGALLKPRSEAHMKNQPAIQENHHEQERFD